MIPLEPQNAVAHPARRALKFGHSLRAQGISVEQWASFGETKNGAEALNQEQIPSESRIRRRRDERTNVGAGEQVWQALEAADYILDFNQLFGEEMGFSVAYAVTYIRSRSDQRGVIMKVGSDDQAKVYLNGKEVYRREQIRGFMADQDEVKDLELKTGLNVVVFKVVDEGADWQGSLRFTDHTGQPLKGIEVSLDPEKNGNP